jgi:hypothetical protein
MFAIARRAERESLSYNSMNPRIREGAAMATDQLSARRDRDIDGGLASAQACGFLFEVPRSEQRRGVRYPIKLEVEYRLLTGSQVSCAGFRETNNISSGEMFFKATDSLPADGLIELALSWPFLLDGVCHLKLAMRGRIVRSDITGTAVKVTRHEFRTCKRPAKILRAIHVMGAQ